MKTIRRSQPVWESFLEAWPYQHCLNCHCVIAVLNDTFIETPLKIPFPLNHIHFYVVLKILYIENKSWSKFLSYQSNLSLVTLVEGLLSFVICIIKHGH